MHLLVQIDILLLDQYLLQFSLLNFFFLLSWLEVFDIFLLFWHFSSLLEVTHVGENMFDIIPKEEAIFMKVSDFLVSHSFTMPKAALLEEE